MAIERERIIERNVEPETVVVNNGAGGNPFGLIAGILIVVVLAVLVFWLIGGGLGGGEAVSVDLPTVTISE